MKFWKIAALVAAAGAIVLLAVAFGARERSIEGEYVLKVNGRYTGASAQITKSGNRYEVAMQDRDGLHAMYLLERLRGTTYTIQDDTGTEAEVRYELTPNGTGLEGTAYVLPVGRITVVFEKSGSSPEEENAVQP